MQNQYIESVIIIEKNAYILNEKSSGLQNHAVQLTSHFKRKIAISFPSFNLISISLFLLNLG